jgi:hypothetical protein
MCSIFKTIELKSLVNTRDPTWDTVDLAIWASSEASIGILIASLPPLRKAFDHLFKYILPSVLRTSHKTPHPSYGQSSGKIRMSTFQNSKAYHSRVAGESVLDNDGASDRAILEDEENTIGGITKTTQVTVSEEIEAPISKSIDLPHNQSQEWREPSLPESSRA